MLIKINRVGKCRSMDVEMAKFLDRVKIRKFELAREDVKNELNFGLRVRGYHRCEVQE